LKKAASEQSKETKQGMKTMIPRLLVWTAASCVSLNLLGLILNLTWLTQQGKIGYFEHTIEMMGGIPFWLLSTILLICANGIAIIRIHYNHSSKFSDDDDDTSSMLLLGANLIVVPMLIIMFVLSSASNETHNDHNGHETGGKAEVVETAE
jgi:uncharacterized membrane protein